MKSEQKEDLDTFSANMDELSSDYKQKLFGSANFKYDYQLSQARRKFGKQV